MIDLLHDLRFALRQFRNRPLWTMAIVVVLALGIGANTAMFSGFDAWVLRPLDFEEPHRLVALHESQPRLGRLSVNIAPRNLGDWMDQAQGFEGLGVFTRHQFNFSDDQAPVRVDGARVSASLFPLLGKRPVVGRGFSQDEDQPAQPASVALISHQLWERRFDFDRAIIGRTIRLDGRTHEIVGVMEPGFKFPEWADVWTPLGLDVDAGDRRDRSVNVIARLDTGTGVEAAATQLQDVAARLARQYPESNEGWSANVTRLRDDFVPPVITTALTMSLVAGVLVLLVVCANVASLILAQASARTREVAVRAALGAGRWRLIRQSVTEGLVLALVAAVLGAWIAVLGVRWTLSWIPVDPPYLFAMGGLNPVGGLYTLGIALLAGLVCGLVPVMQSSGLSVVGILKSGRATASGPKSARFGGTLVAVELALSTALLIGALLMVKSFVALQSAERGYRADSVLTAELNLSGDGFDERGERLAAVDRILTSLGRLDGTARVGVTTHLPAGGGHTVWGLVAQDQRYQPGEAVTATVHGVGGEYLTGLEIPVTDGRTFTESEMRDGGSVALVSQRLASQLWGGGQVVGRHLRDVRRASDAWVRVVGVVGDVDYGRDLTNIGTVPDAQLYLPYADHPASRIVATLASSRRPDELAGPARDALAAILPGVPTEVVDLETALFRVQWMRRYFSNQMAIYAVLATAIAALGLYGLMSHSAGGRRHELAVRMALGASRSDVIQLIVRDAGRLAATGIVVGLALALALTGLGASLLHEVSARDPLVFGGVALLLTVVALVAAFLPARRASRVDPNAVLRAE